MKRNLTLPLHAALAILTFAVDAGFGAPSNEELLSTLPANIIGSFPSNTDYNFTPWQAWSFFVDEGRRKIVFKTVIRLPSSGLHILFDGNYVVESSPNVYRPTATLIEFTKPAEHAGGVWSFSYESFDSTFDVNGESNVISWTWTESEPVPVVPPTVEPNKTKTLALVLNRSAIRAVKGNNPRNALPLLLRQQRLLHAAAD